ncbi:phosphatase PAP2 family protein [bacterium]|nr:phosphatase PAP2 family protein [bacterium]
MKYKNILLIVSVPLITFVWWFFNGGLWITPDVFFVIALIVAFFTHNARLFIVDWSPFLLIFFVYEALRGLIPHAFERAIRQGLITIDSFVFGKTPSEILQKLLWKGSPQWYDIFFTGVYIMHFVIPLVFGFVLWKRSRVIYYRFIISLLVLSFAAFATYYIVPAAPPWLAVDEGLISGVVHIQTHVYMSLGSSVGIMVPHVDSIYDLFGANLVAALPSLHAAYPFLLFLFALKFFDKKIVWLIGTYMVTVWFSVVYLGDHYVFDVALGILYAGVIFYSVNGALDKFIGTLGYQQIVSMGIFSTKGKRRARSN